jgi:hypothetical protein
VPEGTRFGERVALGRGGTVDGQPDLQVAAGNGKAYTATETAIASCLVTIFWCAPRAGVGGAYLTVRAAVGFVRGQFARKAAVQAAEQTAPRVAAKEADEAAGGVYSLRDGAGNVVRTGRSKDLARREAEHARDPVLGRYRFQPEYRTNDYATQRGLEQLLHDDWLPPLNKIRPISPRNPRIDEYMETGRSFRGGG